MSLKLLVFCFFYAILCVFVYTHICVLLLWISHYMKTVQFTIHFPKWWKFECVGFLLFFFFLVYCYCEQSCFLEIVVMAKKKKDTNSKNWKYKSSELVSTSDRISIFKLQSSSTELALSGIFLYCSIAKNEYWLGGSRGILSLFYFLFPLTLYLCRQFSESFWPLSFLLALASTEGWRPHLFCQPVLV